MKKIVAILLAVLMLALPTLSMAASPDEMWEAAAGQRGYTLTYQLDYKGFPGLDADVDAIINDVVDCLGATIVSNGEQTNAALTLSGQEALTLAWTQKGEDTYVNSNLLGGTVVYNAAEGETILNYLMNLAVTNGIITEDAVDLVKTMEQTEGEAETAEIELSEEDTAALMSFLTDIAAKIQTEEVAQQPKNCDAATQVVSLTLTGEDMTRLLTIICDFAKKSTDIMGALAAADLNMYGQSVTPEEFLSRLPGEVGGVVQGDIPMKLYMDAEGNLVYGTLTATMGEEDVAVTMEADYVRLTVSEGVTHAVNLLATNAKQTGISLTVNVLDGEKESKVNVSAASIEKNVASTVLSVDVQNEWDATETEAWHGTAVDVVIADGDESVPISLKVEKKAVQNGEDVSYEGHSNFGILGVDLVSATVNGQTGAELQSIVTDNALRIGQKTEEEFAAYLSEDVVPAAATALVGAMQMLPASVLNLLFEQ